MTDYNSMKADEYAQRQGEMDDMENAIDELADKLLDELPVWAQELSFIESAALDEARSRIVDSVYFRNEP